MKLSDLFVGAEITETNISDLDIEIKGIKTNSKEVYNGDMFISLVGQNANGHKYIGEALERRAAVIVIEDRSCSGDFPYICVPCTRRVYSLVWNNFCNDPSKDINLIAVTGTNGKSSVVAIVSHILGYAGYKCAAIGTLNANLTTPDPPELYPRLRELANNGYEYAVMEASSHALELDKLFWLKFKIGMFTNLSRDHLDFHKNITLYAKAKAKLFELCNVCIYNADDEYADLVTKDFKSQRFSYSSNGKRADFVSSKVKLGLGKTEFDLKSFDDHSRVKSSLTGRYNISNLLCAIACCRVLGLDGKLINDAIETYPGIEGRMEEIDIESKDYRVFIDYAHTPDALYNLLSSIKECVENNSRLVTVFGCGGDRDKGKRAEMGAVATELSDFTVITSDNPRTEDPYEIIKDIVCGINNKKKHLVIVNRRQAIKYVIHSARPGDIIVFCGKGHEKYEICGIEKREFNEKLIIKAADKERNGIKGNEYNSCRQNENVFGGDCQNN